MATEEEEEEKTRRAVLTTVVGAMLVEAVRQQLSPTPATPNCVRYFMLRVMDLDRPERLASSLRPLPIVQRGLRVAVARHIMDMEKKTAAFERRAPRQIASLSITYRCAATLVEYLLEYDDFISREGDHVRMSRAAREFLENLPCVAALTRGRLPPEINLPPEMMLEIFGYLGAQDRRNWLVAAQAEAALAPGMRAAPGEFHCVVVWR